MFEKYCDMKTFTEPNALNLVARFHRLFGLPVLDEPEVPSADRCRLRVSLLEEELEELKEAIIDNDIVAIADALADLQYVLSGAILEFGLADKFASLFNEVQRSNMSKACETEDDALRTREYYLKEKETESYTERKNGQFLVYRKEDGKVLKSINYSEADLQSILTLE